MRSLTDKFDDLLSRLSTPAPTVRSQQGDQVYTLHFAPSEWDEFNQRFYYLKKLLIDKGFDPQVHSFGDICTEIFENDKKYQLQVKLEGMPGIQHEEKNQELSTILTGSRNGELSLESPIILKLKELLDQVSGMHKGILILQHTELLHPHFRVSSIEQILQGKFSVPTVICYPGVRSNISDNPSFLGFYNPDGNYRSTHIY